MTHDPEMNSSRIRDAIESAEEVEAADIEANDGPAKFAQADRLVALAQSADLFHDAGRIGYADFNVTGHRETWPVRSDRFSDFLRQRYRAQTGRVPNAEAMRSALDMIEAQAKYDGPERQLYVRVAERDGRIYLDLADEEWRAIEIDAAGWRVITDVPVRFRRPAGMKPLPEPRHGGSLQTLRRFINVQTDSDFVLAIAWLLTCLRGRAPYPVLVISGEQGSAKSTCTALLRALIDPYVAPLRALPRDERDLFVTAVNAHVLAFDNVSTLPPWMSDTLCRLATGGGFAVRQLYTDQGEVLFDAARPVILNGIEDVVTRPDLADRGLFLHLAPIPEDRRLPEAEFWANFEAARPHILGALLDAVVVGLERLPTTKLDKLPRMADFALWGAACESVLGPPGTFEAAYRGNRDDAVDSVLDADPIAAAVRSLMVTRDTWAGTASDLLGALTEQAGERTTRTKVWPQTPRALGGRLRRLATNLRSIGIDVEFDREGRARTRVIRITSVTQGLTRDPAAAEPSASSAPSAMPLNAGQDNDFVPLEARTETEAADGRTGPSNENVRDNALNCDVVTDADGADANFPQPTVSDAPKWRMTL